MNSLSVLRIQNDVLIPLVEKRPVLWDSTFEVPKRKKVKRKAWKDLCKELLDDFEEMDDDEKDEYVNGVKQRWQCLHDTFFKKKKDLNKSSLGVKKYIYAEKMQFLEKDSMESHLNISASSNGFSNEPSEDVSTHGLPLLKLAADLVLQKENADTSENPKSNDFESVKLTDESIKNIVTGDSHESMLTDEPREDRFVELPKDQFSVVFRKNRFTDEPPKDRSTPKQHARDLGFHKKVAEEINNPKTRKESEKLDKPPEDRYMDKLCTDESLMRTDEPNEDRIIEMPKNGLLKDISPKYLCNNGSTNAPPTNELVKLLTSTNEARVASNSVSQNCVPEKTVNRENGQKSKSQNAEPKHLTDEPSEGSSDESLKDIFAKKLQKVTPSEELSKKKFSTKNQGKNKSTDQLPKNKTSKRSHKHKSKDRLPENRTSKMFRESKSTDQLPKNKTSKSSHKTKSTDPLPEDRNSKSSRKNKSTDQLPEDKTSKRPRESKSPLPNYKTSKRLCESKSTDQLPEDMTSERPRESKCTDPLPSEDKTSKRLCESKSSDPLPSEDKFTGNRSTDKLTDEFPSKPPENGFTGDQPMEESTGDLPQNGYLSKPFNDVPPTLENERDPIYHTGVTEQTLCGEQSKSNDSEVINHLGSMRLKPELSSTFNLFINSVSSHLNELDKTEVLEFQMGVLQVIGHINERRKGPHTLLPQTLYDQ